MQETITLRRDNYIIDFISALHNNAHAITNIAYLFTTPHFGLFSGLISAISEYCVDYK